MVVRPHLILLLLVFACGCDADKGLGGDSANGAEDTAVLDVDNDGYSLGEDCNDDDASVHPGASEQCDSEDDDCDGTVDEEPVDGPTWYVDGDSDGFGAEVAEITSCDQPGAATDQPGDCDDDDDTSYPGASESCDGLDNDCDGQIDEEATDAVACVPDTDADSYGQDVPAQACCSIGSGWVAPGEVDCDDENRSVHPEGAEVCNLLDDDCDGDTDEDDDGDDSVDSLCDLWDEHVLSDADVKILGDYAAGQRSSFLLTDADGDSYDDLWLGAENAYVDGAWKTGLVYLLPGPVVEGGYASEMATATLAGTAMYDEAGHRLDDAGDLDGDGYPELWVVAAADQTTPGIGSIHLMMGPFAGDYTLDDGDLSWVPDDPGWTLSYTDLSVGDYDGDEISDLAIGASVATGDPGGQSGMAWVVRNDGTVGEHDLSDAALVLQAKAEGDRIGWAVAIVGSTTGDGVDDLLVSGFGANTVEGAGQVWVMDETPSDGTYVLDDLSDSTLRGEQPFDNAAGEIMDLGDINGDGYTDFGVGAPGESSGADGAGSIYVVYGPTGTRTSAGEADVKIQGVDEKAAVHLIAGDADIDADGALDLMASGFSYGAGSLPGTAYLFHGPLEEGTMSLLDADATFEGEHEADYGASGLTMSGDTNKDGYPEIVIGAQNYEDETFEGGVLYLYFGQPF